MTQRTGFRRVVAVLAAVLTISPAMAISETAVVQDRDQFLRIIEGRTLARPLVRLNVLPDGSIDGHGAGIDVSGNWSWDGQFFCRDLYWGNDALGYNCQQVSVNGDRLRFTSDRGEGEHAEFRLR